MKKNYVIPVNEVYRIHTHNMLAGSPEAGAKISFFRSDDDETSGSTTIQYDNSNSRCVKGMNTSLSGGWDNEW